MRKISSSSDYYNQSKLHVISERVMDRLEDFFSYFDIDLQLSRRMYYGPCPIHGGDKDNALNIFHTGDYYRGNWKCRTMQCESYFKNSIIGFMRGVLSKQKYDWCNPGDKTVTFQETVDFILDFLNEKIEDIKIDNTAVEKNKFAQQHIQTAKTPKHGPTRDQIRKSLKIPAEYYLNRGYREEILDAYDVGLCVNYKKPMYNRIVVPIYDNHHRFMVGCTGRSVFDRCDKCKKWHNPNEKCPTDDAPWKYAKWRHSKDFKGENYLYNFWNAKKHIVESGIVIVVESPGNVWRLEEAGIHNSVALFGDSLSMGQKTLLDCSGALSLIILMDNDDAGKKGAQIIQERCQRLYHVFNIELDRHSDIGEIKDVQEVRSVVMPILDQAQRKLKL